LRAAGALPINLDVSKAESIAGLAWQLDGEKFDVAVYVAGVFGPSSGAKAEPTAADFDKVMHTNVLGAMQVMPTIAPMVEAARGKFVFISSGMGSIDDAGGSNGWIYRASKAALNMVVKSASFDYPRATLVAMCPGWVQTDMGGPNASLTVEASVGGMLKVINTLTSGDTGSYRNYSGKNLAW
jgi:NAD(P)-dependent dehydrogenase (short-subunit alcohol dehydrogenase family)